MNFVPVTPPAKWRWRRIRQVAWLVALLVVWLAGTASAAVVWWRDHPKPGVVDAAAVAVAFAVLLGCAILHRRPHGNQASNK